MDRRKQRVFLKALSIVTVFLICSALVIFPMPLRITFVEDAWPQTKIKIEGRKTGGIVGDPSRKRGFDLGYDAGPRAGIEDRTQIIIPNFSARPEYMKPEQFYRYEYGSLAAFITGFRSGFMIGYKSAFGKKTSASSLKPSKVGTEKIQPSPKKFTLAEDAL